jgi:hypothetical protein
LLFFIEGQRETLLLSCLTVLVVLGALAFRRGGAYVK